MRKTYVIVLVIFLLVSLCFYTPVRKLLFSNTAVANSSHSQPSQLVSLFSSYLLPEKRSENLPLLADSTLLFRTVLLQSDSQVELYAPVAEVFEREVQLLSAKPLPHGEKEVRLLIQAVSDSSSLEALSDSGRIFFHCRKSDGVQLLSYRLPKQEQRGFKLVVHGRLKLVRPLLTAPSSQLTVANQNSRLLIDLPYKYLVDFDLNKMPDWTAVKLIPPAYQADLTVAALMSGNLPAGFASLPAGWLPMMKRASLVQRRQSDNYLVPQVLFGSANEISRLTVRRQLVDYALLQAQASLPELTMLTCQLQKNLGCACYLYLPDQQPDPQQLKILLTQLQRSAREVAVISSAIPRYHKMNAFLYGCKSSRLTSALELSFVPAALVADSLPYRQWCYADSELVFWQNDTAVSVSRHSIPLQGKLFSRDGKGLGTISLSAAQRQDLQFAGTEVVKLLTWQNNSLQNVCYRLTIRSEYPFSWLSGNRLQSGNARTYLVQLPPRAKRSELVYCSRAGQLFNYTVAEKIQVVYGAANLPAGELSLLQDYSLLTAGRKSAAPASRFDLRIENFTVLPWWRYL